MIEWRDEAVLLAVRRHGETAAIIEVLTAEHGLAAGVVHGGAGRRMAPVLQPGAHLDVAWRARLEEHLGVFRVELSRSRAPLVMGRGAALAGLNALCAMLRYVLPERVAAPAVWARAVAACDMLGEDEVWPLAYLSCEMALMEAAGIGLDLGQCAVTGAREGLCYISPKSGAAVSAAGAGAWASRLLPLPPALLGAASGRAEVLAALEVLSVFWERKHAPQIGVPVPGARARLLDALAQTI